SSVLEFLTAALPNMGLYSSLNTYRTAIVIQLPRNFDIEGSLWLLKIPARLQTSGIGRSQPLLIFKQFLEEPYVFSLIKFYIVFT
ncbi:hypothetical protein ALC56_07316, partial [Trachymyrmex septentrionalis]